MIQDKKEYFSKLSYEGMMELMENLLPNMEIESVTKISSNSFEGTVKSSMGDFKVCYIAFAQPLSKGYGEIDTLVELINKRFNTGYSKVFLISLGSISTGLRTDLERKVNTKNSIVFWDGDDLMSHINDKYPDYWRHSDKALISYETDFETKLIESFEIKKLVEYKAAYQKLLSIFIEPNLQLRTEDKQSTKRAFTKINIDRAIEENKRMLLLHGEPGVGKTRLLNEIGKKLIEKNTIVSGKRYLPVLIDSISLRDTFVDKGDVDICKLIVELKLNKHFQNQDIDDVFNSYQLVLLIDSIDEFEKKYRDKIIKELECLMDKGTLVFLCTRSTSMEDVFKSTARTNIKEVFIQKFSDHQVEKFAERYFFGDGNRAKGLIESMKENKILEKLPLTPLNLSLMSILYEETNLEIPATLTDIYDKFSNLLLGRTTVNKSFDFLDITIKENILGIYALELLKRKNSELMTRDEFIEFFKENLSSVSGTIDLNLLPQALDFIIEHTGLLILHQGKYVKFRHDSYMEYFAAKEIFKHHRNMEADLVENFFDVNWQYAAVFYAGLSRRMPQFLEQIIDKVSKSGNFREYWSSANGMGYLLQALYLTDDNIRKKGVLETLRLMVETYEAFKKMSSVLPQTVLFSRIPLPILSIFPIFLFQDNFDSITLKKPLSMALDELLVEYEQKELIPNYPYLDNIIYRILILAITVSSDRLNMEDKLLSVIDKINARGNDFYIQLLNSAIDNLGGRELRKQKNAILKPIKVRTSDKNENLYFLKGEIDKIMLPASRQRFTQYDTIIPNKKVKIFVEGVTDAILMEQAFFVLTGNMPYWELKACDGANDVVKKLDLGIDYLEEGQMAIGILDNDRKGIPEFKGVLKSPKFDLLESYTRIKKNKEGNIFAMLLPIPEDKQHYIQPNQEDNYFTIEHYLPNEYLIQFGVLESTAIPLISKIKDNGKMNFAKETAKLNSLSLFQGFILLFREIDKITGMEGEINYKEI